MQDFEITLRLNTPLLQGGPEARQLDPVHYLRGPSVRGLLHTFTRALVGPLVAGNPGATREAEAALLGTAAGEGGSATFRLQDISEEPLTEAGEYANCPHDLRKGKSPGYAAGASRTLAFRPRAHAVAANDRFAGALWSVVWTAFTFGSLGKRSRRGYGSFVIEQAHGVPFEMPLFYDRPTNESDLARRLRDGFRLATSHLTDWLTAAIPDLPLGRSSGPHTFFQLADMYQVRIGRPKPERRAVGGNIFGMEDVLAKLGIDDGDESGQMLVPSTGWISSEDGMRSLMRASSDACARSPRVFQATIGAPLPRELKQHAGGRAAVARMSSPVWVRTFPLADRHHVLVVLVSHRRAGRDGQFVEEFLEGLEATPDRSVDALAK